jgi:CheY-like chemotaxis protein
MEQPRPLRVLVVEDDRDIALVLKTILEIEGFSVFLASDGQHALSLLDATDPDVILCDLMMPVLDGFGFLRAYAARPGRHAPVIAASAIRAYLPKAREAGAAAVLVKPYDVVTLAPLLRQHAAGVAAEPPPAPSPEEAIEVQRLRAVLEMALDQPTPEGALREFTARVARIFEVPICLVSAITKEQQYWTSSCGLAGELASSPGWPRRESFCTHAVEGRAALVVQDAAENPFFADNIFITRHGIRFYAGVPLITRRGDALGTLCVLDHRPRRFSYFDLELLCVLGRRVLGELEWREAHADERTPLSTFRYLTYMDEELGVLGREGLCQALRVQACRAAERQMPLAVVVVEASPIAPAAHALEAAFPNDSVGRLDTSRLGIAAFGRSPGEAAAIARRAAGEGARVHAVAVHGVAEVAEAALAEAEAVIRG